MRRRAVNEKKGEDASGMAKRVHGMFPRKNQWKSVMQKCILCKLTLFDLSVRPRGAFLKAEPLLT